jgi:chromosome segregation ATPase
MVRINRFDIENVKRVQAVQLEPSPNGLTIIGGRNAQGKTSVLDAIVWALGGNKHRPSKPKRDDSFAEPTIVVELDNGIVVRREGKNASLKVLDERGNKAGQALLDELISQLALDLPRFLNSSGREKAEILLQVIGVGEQLMELDHKAESLYNERHALGQIATRKRKHAEDLPFIKDAPEEEVSASDLIQRQQAILAKNGENQRLRQQRDDLERSYQQAITDEEEAKRRLAEATQRRDEVFSRLKTARKSAEDLQDESTAEIEKSLTEIDLVNQKVRTNATKRAAEKEASQLQLDYDALTEQLEDVRRQRVKLLEGANLPLPGLSVESGELTYRGKAWDCMSSAEQLRVSVAIVRRLRPDCHFVLLDKTEQMDTATLTEFGAWLEQENLQVIATRVSTGDECSVIIEDGMVRSDSATTTIQPQPVSSEEGF